MKQCSTQKGMEKVIQARTMKTNNPHHERRSVVRLPHRVAA
jgi:hypothetical protein